MLKQTKALKQVGQIDIPSLDKIFVVNEYFKLGKVFSGINWNVPDFIRYNPVVLPRSGYTVNIHQVSSGFCSNYQIQRELGLNSELDFAALHYLLERQKQVGDEPLLMNIECNVFLMKGVAFWVRWGDGPGWTISLIEPIDERTLWDENQRIFSKEIPE